MKTIWKNLIGAGALVGVTSLVTARVVSQQEQPPPDMEEMFEAWMQFAAPGPEHAKIAKLAGTWKQTNTHWMYPGAEPAVSETTAIVEPILGGRFMLQKMHGRMDMMGQPYDFEALGIFGYDNMKQKHFYAWVDNLGTLMMVAEGASNVAGDAITYESELPDPMTGGTMTLKSVSRMVNENETVFEMHQLMPDGSWFQNMEVRGTRQHAPEHTKAPDAQR